MGTNPPVPKMGEILNLLGPTSSSRTTLPHAAS